MKVRAPDLGSKWRLYADNLLAPLCRKRNGSMTPKVHTLYIVYDSSATYYDYPLNYPHLSKYVRMTITWNPHATIFLLNSFPNNGR